MAAREFVCSSHTISGVIPGSPIASRHGFVQRVEACAAAGYRGMCLHFRDYAEQRQEGMSNAELRAILDRNGMKYVSIEFLTDWFMDGDAGELSRRNEAIAFEAARALGATVVNVGPDLGERGISAETMRRKFVELCSRAEEQGLSMALELVAWGNVRSVDTALPIIDGIRNAGLVVDSWHVFRAGVPLEDLKRIPAERILCVQVNDANARIEGTLAADTMHRKLCGQGAFDLRAFVAVLDVMGVVAPLSVEVISPDLADRELEYVASTSLTTARNCFAI
ncbi:sugar phosphate isomerase/epimerase family protein [Aminobacter sp. HY435]|uniref:sugar phosphate isomerase/epimerase family protein n=1 Tax=Aminobacter sp. HY435 TaxID=2970917 RepID=UPI0022B9B43C|nr:sugar phosphate isomerase/epimerase [Aminobacter sp. HY435]